MKNVMARWINFLFLIWVLGWGFWLFSHTPWDGVIHVPAQVWEQGAWNQNNWNQEEQAEVTPINPLEEAAKLNIQTPLYDDCDVAKIFYGEGLKIEYCTVDEFHYRQKTTYGFDGDPSSVMYDIDAKELSSWGKHTDASGTVTFSGMSFGGTCRIVGSIEEACAKK